MLRWAMWPDPQFLDHGARTPIWAAVLGGAGIGLAWGIVARMLMSLIADVSEFTVPGTTGILAIFTSAGAFAGLAFGARRRGWRSWRVYLPRSLAAVAIVPLAIAAEMGPVLLISLLATLGVAWNEWPRTVRGVLLVVALGGLIASTLLIVADQTPPNQEALVVPLVAWIFYGYLLALRVGLEPAVHAAAPDEAGQPAVRHRRRLTHHRLSAAPSSANTALSPGTPRAPGGLATAGTGSRPKVAAARRR